MQSPLTEKKRERVYKRHMRPINCALQGIRSSLLYLVPAVGKQKEVACGSKLSWALGATALHHNRLSQTVLPGQSSGSSEFPAGTMAQLLSSG